MGLEDLHKHANVTSETEYKEVYEESRKFVKFVKNKIKKDFADIAKELP